MLRKIAYLILVSVCSEIAIAQSSDNSPATSSNNPAEHARVFITDSQSWEIAGHSGGGGGAFASEAHGGARPQTAEIIKTFGERCPDVVTNNIQSKADYIVLLDHEGGKGVLRHRNKVAVFTRVTGDSVVSKSTLSLGGSVQTACEAIHGDWTKNSASIRAAEANETAPAASKSKVAEAPLPIGSIQVISTPDGADVYSDGEFVGNAPSTLKLGTGKHTVRVTASGYKDWSRDITVQPGSDAKLNATLEKN